MSRSFAPRRRRFIQTAAILGLGLAAGCRSIDPTAGLSPSGEIGTVQPDRAPLAPAEAASPAASVGPVQFLPLVGAPVPVAEALSAALAAEAARAGIDIAPADAPATPLRLKGYLSAVREGGGRVVVYVWDVVDPAGERVSRIQGQERSAGVVSGADPWAGLSEETIAAIARRTIADLRRMRTAG